MPTMANITVKKADGTTDVTYEVVTPSGGDKSPAVWRHSTAGGTPGQRPILRIITRPNGPGGIAGRKVEINFTFPSIYTDSSTGLTKVLTRNNFQGVGFVADDTPTATNDEFAAQLGNLLASALVKSINSSGYSAV